MSAPIGRRSVFLGGVRLSAAAFFAVVGAAIFATPAFAHDGVVSSTPEAGAVVERAPEVVITFSEDLLDLGADAQSFGILVTDTEGRYFESGCVDLTGMQLSTATDLGDAGTYSVQWQVVSSDGHPTSGEFAFDYQPKSDAPAAAGSPNPVECAPAESVVLTEEPILTEDEQQTVLRTMGITALVCLVIGVGGVILLARRVDRRKAVAAKTEREAEDARLALPELNRKHCHNKK